MERHVDTRKGNSSESSLKLDITFCLLLFLGFLETTRNNILQHFLDLLDGKLLGELNKGLTKLHHIWDIQLPAEYRFS